jgi:hypothetical protein
MLECSLGRLDIAAKLPCTLASWLSENSPRQNGPEHLAQPSRPQTHLDRQPAPQRDLFPVLRDPFQVRREALEKIAAGATWILPDEVQEWGPQFYPKQPFHGELSRPVIRHANWTRPSSELTHRHNGALAPTFQGRLCEQFLVRETFQPDFAKVQPWTIAQENSSLETIPPRKNLGHILCQSGISPSTEGQVNRSTGSARISSGQTRIRFPLW